MPGAFDIIRKELPKFLEEPHAQDFVDAVSAFVPTTAEDVGLSLALGPLSRLRPVGAAIAAAAPQEAEASPLARGLIKSGGALKNWLDEAIEHALSRRTHDAGEVERIERIAKELPIVPTVYSPKALAERAVFAAPNELVEMPAGRFGRLAERLSEEQLAQSAPYLEHYKDLIKAGEWVEPPPGLFKEHYLERQRQAPYKGFTDIPYLLTKEGKVVGHEGRHRNLAIADLFGLSEPSIVDIRGLGNRTELLSEGTGYPIQLEYTTEKLPFKRFSDGGLAHYADGGLAYNHPFESGYYAVPNRYADGGLAQYPKKSDEDQNQNQSYAEGGAITDKAMLNRLISAYNEL